MALEIQHFTVTIPAGTPITAPVTTAITLPVRIVRQVDWRVPAGPLGLMGWRLTMGKVKVLPQGDDWVIANGESGSWHVDDLPDSGAWQVTGYNTGTHPHSVYVVMHCDLPNRPRQLPAPLPALGFMPAPDLSRAGPPVRARA